MASFVKFEQFAVDLAAGFHDLTDSTTLKVCLTDTQPTPGTDAVLSDITQSVYTNITETPPNDVTNVGTETPAGTWDIAGTDITLNATGNVAQFQWVVLYNDTQTSPVKPLIGYWDNGSKVNLTNGDTFTIQFGTSILTVA